MQIQERNDAPLEMRREGNFLTKIFKYLFCIQFLLIMILAFYLTVRGVISASDNHRFHQKKWYFPVLSSTVCAGIVGFAWQLFTSCNPSRAFKATFFISPLLTCAYGILLVSIGSPGSAAAAVFTLVSAVVQSIYACWAHPRFQHASKILVVSIAYHPPRVKTVVPVSMFVCILYSTILMSGVGGATATGTKVNTLFIFLSLLSFTWTTMGSICIGSILVPVLGVIRGSARAISLVSGDVDEFMFSCANCCAGVAKGLVASLVHFAS